MKTSVVFVHGFTSNPACWDPFFKRLQSDDDFPTNAYRFTRIPYPTEAAELNPAKRIPGIDECGKYLEGFLRQQPEYDHLFLVGHSMGGLVIQSFLAQAIGDGRGKDLAKIRSVILFATPNRGSTKLGGVRAFFSRLFKNPQEESLRVWDPETARVSDVVTRRILEATGVSANSCPIPFRAFWGMQDDIVPEVSARGSFAEASPLPGGHSEILHCVPEDPEDPQFRASTKPERENGRARYQALKEALLHPIGHPSIYEIDLFEANLALSPFAPQTNSTLSGDEVRPGIPIPPATDNVAIRTMQIRFSKQNRCSLPYDQTYRSQDGLVEILELSHPNEATTVAKSTYRNEGKEFTYLFTPDRETVVMKLRIYNGFGEGQRTWHNHMKVNARYKLFRFILDLKGCQNASYRISNDPTMYFHPKDDQDHTLCNKRENKVPLPYVPSADPWVRTWEIPDVQGGVVDLVWDVKKPDAK